MASKKRKSEYTEEEKARYKPGLETRFPHIATMLMAMNDEKAARVHARKLFPHLQKRVLVVPRKKVVA